MLPGLGMQITEDALPRLKEIIDRCIENPAYQAARDQARRETWCCEGESTGLVADYLMSKIGAAEPGQNPDGAAGSSPAGKNGKPE